MVGFDKYMSEKKNINRWFILLVGMVGAFAGALIAVMFMMLAVVS